jgi:hypothetical protein
LFGRVESKQSRKIYRTGLSDSCRFTQTSCGKKIQIELKLVIKMTLRLFQLTCNTL